MLPDRIGTLLVSTKFVMLRILASLASWLDFEELFQGSVSLAVALEVDDDDVDLLDDDAEAAIAFCFA